MTETQFDYLPSPALEINIDPEILGTKNSFIDLEIPEAVIGEVIDLCNDRNIRIANSTIDGRLRFWGQPSQLHVLKSNFS